MIPCQVAEASANERCVDAAGRAWDVPRALTLDLSSKPPRKGPKRGRVGGLAYAAGLHRSATPVLAPAGGPDSSTWRGEEADWTNCAQAAASFSKTVHLWKQPADHPEKKAKVGYRVRNI
jgi:hypothetical protein